MRTIDGSASLGTIICGLTSNLATYLVCVKPEQKDVLYIFFQERAIPDSTQATSSAKCKKKKHRQIAKFNSLLFTDFTEKKRILYTQLTSENPSRSVANE